MTIGVIPSGDGVALGTGVATTELTPAQGNLMPGDARMLLKVIPLHADITPTTVQSINTQLEIRSSDILNISPYFVLFPPISAGLGATYNTLTGKETWDINAPLTGGENYHAFATPLVANAVAPQAMAHFLISNDPKDYAPAPQYHSKLGTLTATGTTANADVAGTPYSINGVQFGVTEIFGIVHPKTIAAGDAILGQIKMVSSDFRDAYYEMCPVYAQSFGLGATGSFLTPGVSRQKVNIPKKAGITQVNLQDYLRLSLLPASAGSFISGVVYV